MVKTSKEMNGCVFEAFKSSRETWWCSILLRRSVVYFLRANIEGEVWLIMPDYFFKFSRWRYGCVPKIGVLYYYGVKGQGHSVTQHISLKIIVTFRERIA